MMNSRKEERARANLESRQKFQNPEISKKGKKKSQTPIKLNLKFKEDGKVEKDLFKTEKSEAKKEFELEMVNASENWFDSLPVRDICAESLVLNYQYNMEFPKDNVRSSFDENDSNDEDCPQNFYPSTENSGDGESLDTGKFIFYFLSLN